MKIVSLLPSATEMICALGLENQLVGVTHECDFPASVRGLPKVTRSHIPAGASSAQIDQFVRQNVQAKRPLYALDLAALQTLQPNLIITQALCDVCAVSEEEVRSAACELPGRPRVINLEPQTLLEVLAAIRQVARAAGVEPKGDEVVAALSARIDAVATHVASARGERPRVALLEWLDPPFSCGHWNPELVRLAGGIEGLGAEGKPSRRLSWSEVAGWRPEIICIACCGFSIERTLEDLPPLLSLPQWQHLPAVRSGQVWVMNGSEFFNRPGPRLVDSLETLAHVFGPESHLLRAGLHAPLRWRELASGAGGA